MSTKGGGTQGYRYYLSLLSGLCRASIDELTEIRVGGETAWSGNKCDDRPEVINAENLFGGEDKEGGIKGQFRVFMGRDDQVLPSGGDGSFVDDPRGSIGGLVSQFRGAVTVWYDGMVSAMNPYLKEWTYRVRRSQNGWHGGTWYPSKATIFLGSDNLNVTSNQPTQLAVSALEDGTMRVTFARNAVAGDEIVVNGQKITFVDGKQEDAGTYELVPNRNRERTVRNVANFINGKSTIFKATATYTATTVTIAQNEAAAQIYAMNPAHIIYQCYTDPLWGRGLDREELDESSFVYAANTFCNEKFGIALIWYRKEEIDVFIQKICDLAGLVNYEDRETGRIVIRPIRGDYIPSELPLFTPESGLLSITNEDSNSSEDSYNEIIGTSVDPVTNLEFQVRAQNLAAYQSQRAASSLDQDYKGIPTKELLSRVVLRDLRAMSSGLKKFTVKLDRRAWRITPGSCFRVSHPSRGISNLVLRAGEIDDGDLVNGTITISAIVDVFSLPETSYIEPVENGWIGPSKVATPALDERLIEAGYRDLYRKVGAAEANQADATSAYIGQLALQPNATSLEYDLATRVEGEADFAIDTRGPFTGNALLAADVGPLDTAWPLTSLQMFGQDNVGEALLIGDELVRLDSLADGTATVTRGVGDTIPQSHEEGETLWTIDDDLVSDGREYLVGETVFTKVLTRTATQVLPIENADELSVKLVGRQARPYPPADVKLNGTSVYLFPDRAEEPVVTWSERNRLTLADTLVGHQDATMSPEEGQTYTVRVKDKSGAVLSEHKDIVGGTWTYTAALQAADGSPNSVTVELESARGEVTSWQHYSFAIVLKGGWGYGWGRSWGG